MKILIATGIYPPQIGGPAQYARNLWRTWREKHEVTIATYTYEHAFPTGLRHLLFMLKVLRKGWNADFIIVLDTWSALVPTMFAAKFLRKKYIVRTGGDFLWESYVERTGDLVLFRDFYDTRMAKLSKKEKLIYKWSGNGLRNANKIIFSTDWQRRIFQKAYNLDPAKNTVVENFIGIHEEGVEPQNRNFVAGTRVLKWKNVELLKRAFEKAKTQVKNAGLEDIELDTGKAVYDSFVEKIKHSYAVILVSLGDISPNMIFDAIRVGVPFILTKETGIKQRVESCALFVDPKDENDIAAKIVWLANPANRALQAKKVQEFSFVHTWQNIADEILGVAKK